MLFRIDGMMLLCATALASSVAAQSPPCPPRSPELSSPRRKLPTVTEVPLYFGAMTSPCRRAKPAASLAPWRPLSDVGIDGDRGR